MHASMDFKKNQWYVSPLQWIKHDTSLIHFVCSSSWLWQYSYDPKLLIQYSHFFISILIVKLTSQLETNMKDRLLIIPVKIGCKLIGPILCPCALQCMVGNSSRSSTSCITQISHNTWIRPVHAIGNMLSYLID